MCFTHVFIVLSLHWVCRNVLLRKGCGKGKTQQQLYTTLWQKHGEQEKHGSNLLMSPLTKTFISHWYGSSNGENIDFTKHCGKNMVNIQYQWLVLVPHHFQIHTTCQLNIFYKDHSTWSPWMSTETAKNLQLNMDLTIFVYYFRP